MYGKDNVLPNKVMN